MAESAATRIMTEQKVTDLVADFRSGLPFASGENLDAYTFTATRNVNTTTISSSLANTPTTSPGFFESKAKDANNVLHTYTTHGTIPRVMYVRTMQNGAWNPWKGAPLGGEIISSPADFGAAGDGITDDTAALNNWLADTGLVKDFGKTGTYRITGGLISNRAGRTITASGSKIVADAANITMLTINGADTTTRGLAMDGQSKAGRGIKINAGGTVTERNTVVNIGSRTVQSTLTVLAIGATTTGGGIIRDNVIKNIYALGDGIVPGNGTGMSRAIAISGADIPPASPATMPFVVERNYIDGVAGEEGDGIAVGWISLDADNVPTFPSGKVIIRNNTLKNCTKRFIKTQASDCTVENNKTFFDLPAVDPSWTSHITAYRGINTVIRGNETCPMSTNRTHIHVDQGANVTGVVVENNIVRCGAGLIGPAVYVARTDDAVISGNKVYGGTIAFNVANRGVMQNNTVYGGEATRPAFDVAGGTSCVVKGNTDMFAGRTAASVNNTGTGAVNSNNDKAV